MVVLNCSKWILFVFLLFSASIVKAQTTVNVALTSIQPPFVFDVPDHGGLAKDVFFAMNRVQNDFYFDAKLYPPSRAVLFQKEEGIDLVAFNDVLWGWKKLGGLPSLSLTNGSDVFL